MYINEIIGYVGALLMGVSLGLIGAGGSILTVPILVYLFHIGAEQATGYSLFVVGLTSVIGSMAYIREKKVDFKTAIVFGIPSIIGVFSARAFIVPAIPKVLFSVEAFTMTKPLALLLLFAVIMLLASYSMIKPSKKQAEDGTQENMKFNYPLILVEGLVVGIVTGLVGAGGGFLIIPALVLLARLPMSLAVGTSLLIIGIKSLIGFAGEMGAEATIDWPFLLIFSGISIVGIFIGTHFNKLVPSEKLKPAFGYFVLVMGGYIIIKELFFA